MAYSVKMDFVTTPKKQWKIIHSCYVYIFQKDLANQVQSFECQLRRKGQSKEKADHDNNIVGHTMVVVPSKGNNYAKQLCFGN